MAVSDDPDIHEAATLVTGERSEAATVVFDDRVPACLGSDRAPTVVSLEAATVVRGRPEPRRMGATSQEDGPPPAAGPASGVVRYVVEGVAGRGGMGTVHIARDIDLLRRVALKELTPAAAQHQGARARFVREVQVTAQLDHPHIVPVYGLEVAQGGVPAYAMKLVEGRTFAQLIADTRAAYESGGRPDEDHDLPARLEHFLKVCDAIEYAHDRGVVHRDLKPANLMLGRHNEVYVMDWGICRLVAHQAADAEVAVVEPARAADENQTAYGAIVGTPLYMSPEQAEGRHGDLDARSDQCALGLILFELVTLQRPFGGRTLGDIIQEASAGVRRPVAHAFKQPVPAELAAIVQKATARQPGDRYRSVAAMADDLRRFLRGEAVEARPDSAWGTFVRRLARHRQAVALGVLGFAVLALATIAFLIWRHDRALEAQNARDRRIQAFVADVAELGDRLQTRLIEIDGELEAMAAAAAFALEFGTPRREAVRWEGQPAPAEAAAADVLFAAAPGTSRAAVAPAAQRLVHAAGANTRMLDLIRRHLASRRDPEADPGLIALRAGFASGLQFVHPAKRPDLGRGDLREASWYRAVREHGGFQWTPTNADDDAQRELTVSVAVLDSRGGFQGALGIVLSLDHLLANLLADLSLPGVRAALLLDARATLLLDADHHVLATHAAETARAGSGDGYLEALPLDEIVRVVNARDVGYLETDRLGTPHLVAFDHIYPAGWTLLVVIEESKL